MHKYNTIIRYAISATALVSLTGCLSAPKDGTSLPGSATNSANFSPITLGTEGDDFSRSIVTDAQGVGYVVGELNRNSTTAAQAFISKIGLNNETLWTIKSVGNSDTYAESVALSPDNSIVVAGFFGVGSNPSSLSVGSETVTTQDSEATNMFLAKVDADGKTLWLKSVNAGPLDAARSVAVDAQGYIYVSGDSASALGNTNASLIKFTPAGEKVWSMPLVATEYSSAHSVRMASNGDVLVAGYFTGSVSTGSQTLVSRGSYDGFAMRVSAQGKTVWFKALGGSTDNDYAYDILETKDSKVVVTGYYAGQAEFGSSTLNSEGGSDAYLAVLDEQGNVTQALSVGSAKDDYSYNLTTKGNNFVVAGRFTGSMQIGNVSLAEKSRTGLFIAEFTSSLAPLSAISSPSTGLYYSYDVAARPDGTLLAAAYYEEEFTANNETVTSVGYNDAIVYLLQP